MERSTVVRTQEVAWLVIGHAPNNKRVAGPFGSERSPKYCGTSSIDIYIGKNKSCLTIGGLTIGPLAFNHVESLINWKLFSVDDVHGNFKAQTYIMLIQLEMDNSP